MSPYPWQPRPALFPNLDRGYRAGQGNSYRNRALGPVLPVLRNADRAICATARLATRVQSFERGRGLASREIRRLGCFRFGEDFGNHSPVLSHPDLSVEGGL